VYADPCGLRSTTISRRSAASFASYLSGASLAGLALLGYETQRFPASLGKGGFTQAVVAGAALFACLVASRYATRVSSAAGRDALQSGAGAGVALGAAAILGHTLEVFATLQPPIPAVLGVGMWGLMFLVLGGTSAETYRREESIALGILSSVWGALISAVTTVVFAFLVGLLFMARMQQVLAGAFALSGMTDGRAFVIRNMLEGATSHLLLAPAVAVLAGSASVTTCFLLKSVGRRTAAALAACALTVLVGGVTSLRFASSLERSARPPFVMLGLLGLGVALTSAGPLLAAIRGVKGMAVPRGKLEG
jgi:hypothetical protein